MKRGLKILFLALLFVNVARAEAESSPDSNNYDETHERNYEVNNNNEEYFNKRNEDEVNTGDYYKDENSFVKNTNPDDFNDSELNDKYFNGADDKSKSIESSKIDRGYDTESDFYDDDWKQKFNEELNKYIENDEVVFDDSDSHDTYEEDASDSKNDYDGSGLYNDEKDINDSEERDRRHDKSKKDTKHVISEELKKVLGYSGNWASSELLYQLTGRRDESSAIDYIKQITGLTDEAQAHEFIVRSHGSRNWKIVIDFMKSLEGTTDIRVIVDLLKELTGESDVFKAFDILGHVAGYGNFDGIYECLQKISGARGPYEIGQHFKQIGEAESGIAGIRTAVYKLTGGMGPAELPLVVKVLASESDVRGTFTVLEDSMGTEDYSVAILELTKLLEVPTFPDAVVALKTLTRQTQLKYAIEELIRSFKKNNLKTIFDNLHRICGSDSIEELRETLFKVFGIDDVPFIAYEAMRISNNPDALDFLFSLIDLTRAKDIRGANQAINTLTNKKLTIFEIIEGISITSKYDDVTDLFRKLITYTGTRRLQDAWYVISRIAHTNDIFEFFKHLERYTKMNVVAFMSTLIRVTNSRDLQSAFAVLSKTCERRGFFEIMSTIRRVTRMDVAVFFEQITTISEESHFEEIVSLLQEYTETDDFLDAIKELKRVTGERDYQRAIDYIKHNKSRFYNRKINDGSITEHGNTNKDSEIHSDEYTNSKSFINQDKKTVNQEANKYHIESVNENIQEKTKESLKELKSYEHENENLFETSDTSNVGVTDELHNYNSKENIDTYQEQSVDKSHIVHERQEQQDHIDISDYQRDNEDQSYDTDLRRVEAREAETTKRIENENQSHNSMRHSDESERVNTRESYEKREDVQSSFQSSHESKDVVQSEATENIQKRDDSVLIHQNQIRDSDESKSEIDTDQSHVLETHRESEENRMNEQNSHNEFDRSRSVATNDASNYEENSSELHEQSRHVEEAEQIERNTETKEAFHKETSAHDSESIIENNHSSHDRVSSENNESYFNNDNRESVIGGSELTRVTNENEFVDKKENRQEFNSHERQAGNHFEKSDTSNVGVTDELHNYNSKENIDTYQEQSVDKSHIVHERQEQQDHIDISDYQRDNEDQSYDTDLRRVEAREAETTKRIENENQSHNSMRHSDESERVNTRESYEKREDVQSSFQSSHESKDVVQSEATENIQKRDDSVLIHQNQIRGSDESKSEIDTDQSHVLETHRESEENRMNEQNSHNEFDRSRSVATNDASNYEENSSELHEQSRHVEEAEQIERNTETKEAFHKETSAHDSESIIENNHSSHDRVSSENNESYFNNDNRESVIGGSELTRVTNENEFVDKKENRQEFNSHERQAGNHFEKSDTSNVGVTDELHNYNSKENIDTYQEQSVDKSHIVHERQEQQDHIDISDYQRDNEDQSYDTDLRRVEAREAETTKRIENENQSHNSMRHSDESERVNTRESYEKREDVQSSFQSSHESKDVVQSEATENIQKRDDSVLIHQNQIRGSDESKSEIDTDQSHVLETHREIEENRMNEQNSHNEFDRSRSVATNDASNYEQKSSELHEQSRHVEEAEQIERNAETKEAFHKETSAHDSESIIENNHSSHDRVSSENNESYFNNDNRESVIGGSELTRVTNENEFVDKKENRQEFNSHERQAGNHFEKSDTSNVGVTDELHNYNSKENIDTYQEQSVDKSHIVHERQEQQDHIDISDYQRDNEDQSYDTDLRRVEAREAETTKRIENENQSHNSMRHSDESERVNTRESYEKREDVQSSFQSSHESKDVVQSEATENIQKRDDSVLIHQNQIRGSDESKSEIDTDQSHVLETHRESEENRMNEQNSHNEFDRSRSVATNDASNYEENSSELHEQSRHVEEAEQIERNTETKEAFHKETSAHDSESIIENNHSSHDRVSSENNESYFNNDNRESVIGGSELTRVTNENEFVDKKENRQEFNSYERQAGNHFEKSDTSNVGVTDELHNYNSKENIDTYQEQSVDKSHIVHERQEQQDHIDISDYQRDNEDQSYDTDLRRVEAREAETTKRIENENQSHNSMRHSDESERVNTRESYEKREDVQSSFQSSHESKDVVQSEATENIQKRDDSVLIHQNQIRGSDESKSEIDTDQSHVLETHRESEENRMNEQNSHNEFDRSRSVATNDASNYEENSSELHEQSRHVEEAEQIERNTETKEAFHKETSAHDSESIIENNHSSHDRVSSENNESYFNNDNRESVIGGSELTRVTNENEFVDKKENRQEFNSHERQAGNHFEKSDTSNVGVTDELHNYNSKENIDTYQEQSVDKSHIVHERQEQQDHIDISDYQRDNEDQSYDTDLRRVEAREAETTKRIENENQSHNSMRHSDESERVNTRESYEKREDVQSSFQSSHESKNVVQSEATENIQKRDDSVLIHQNQIRGSDESKSEIDTDQSHVLETHRESEENRMNEQNSHNEFDRSRSVATNDASNYEENSSGLHEQSRHVEEAEQIERNTETKEAFHKETSAHDSESIIENNHSSHDRVSSENNESYFNNDNRESVIGGSELTRVTNENEFVDKKENRQEFNSHERQAGNHFEKSDTSNVGVTDELHNYNSKENIDTYQEQSVDKSHIVHERQEQQDHIDISDYQRDNEDQSYDTDLRRVEAREAETTKRIENENQSHNSMRHSDESERVNTRESYEKREDVQSSFQSSHESKDVVQSEATENIQKRDDSVLIHQNQIRGSDESKSEIDTDQSHVLETHRESEENRMNEQNSHNEFDRSRSVATNDASNYEENSSELHEQSRHVEEAEQIERNTETKEAFHKETSAHDSESIIENNHSSHDRVSSENNESYFNNDNRESVIGGSELTRVTNENEFVDKKENRQEFNSHERQAGNHFEKSDTSNVGVTDELHNYNSKENIDTYQEQSVDKSHIVHERQEQQDHIDISDYQRDNEDQSYDTDLRRVEAREAETTKRIENENQSHNSMRHSDESERVNTRESYEKREDVQSSFQSSHESKDVVQSEATENIQKRDNSVLIDQNQIRGSDESKSEIDTDQSHVLETHRESEENRMNEQNSHNEFDRSRSVATNDASNYEENSSGLHEQSRHVEEAEQIERNTETKEAFHKETSAHDSESIIENNHSSHDRVSSENNESYFNNDNRESVIGGSELTRVTNENEFVDKKENRQEFNSHERQAGNHFEKSDTSNVGVTDELHNYNSKENIDTYQEQSVDKSHIVHERQEQQDHIDISDYQRDNEDQSYDTDLRRVEAREAETTKRIENENQSHNSMRHSDESERVNTRESYEKREDVQSSFQSSHESKDVVQSEATENIQKRDDSVLIHQNQIRGSDESKSEIDTDQSHVLETHRESEENRMNEQNSHNEFDRSRSVATNDASNYEENSSELHEQSRHVEEAEQIERNTETKEAFHKETSAHDSESIIENNHSSHDRVSSENNESYFNNDNRESVIGGSELTRVTNENEFVDKKENRQEFNSHERQAGNHFEKSDTSNVGVTDELHNYNSKENIDKYQEQSVDKSHIVHERQEQQDHIDISDYQRDNEDQSYDTDLRRVEAREAETTKRIENENQSHNSMRHSDESERVNTRESYEKREDVQSSFQSSHESKDVVQSEATENIQKRDDSVLIHQNQIRGSDESKSEIDTDQSHVLETHRESEENRMNEQNSHNEFDRSRSVATNDASNYEENSSELHEQSRHVEEAEQIERNTETKEAFHKETSAHDSESIIENNHSSHDRVSSENNESYFNNDNRESVIGGSELTRVTNENEFVDKKENRQEFNSHERQAGNHFEKSDTSNVGVTDELHNYNSKENIDKYQEQSVDKSHIVHERQEQQDHIDISDYQRDNEDQSYDTDLRRVEAREAETTKRIENENQSHNSMRHSDESERVNTRESYEKREDVQSSFQSSHESKDVVQSEATENIQKRDDSVLIHQNQIRDSDESKSEIDTDQSHVLETHRESEENRMNEQNSHNEFDRSRSVATNDASNYEENSSELHEQSRHVEEAEQIERNTETKEAFHKEISAHDSESIIENNHSSHDRVSSENNESYFNNDNRESVIGGSELTRVTNENEFVDKKENRQEFNSHERQAGNHFEKSDTSNVGVTDEIHNYNSKENIDTYQEQSVDKSHIVHERQEQQDRIDISDYQRDNEDQSDSVESIELTRESVETSRKNGFNQVGIIETDMESQDSDLDRNRPVLDEPAAPAHARQYKRDTGVEFTGVSNSGGKLALNQGKKDIYKALEADMDLKIVMLPDGPHGNNCFCTCDSNSAPKLIEVNDQSKDFIES